jgi:hypothetical protein
MTQDTETIRGVVVAELWRPLDLCSPALRCAPLEYDPDTNRVRIQRVVVGNIITQVGDQYYGERATGIGSPPGQVTGMRLGTGTTAPSKTGAGAAIVTYVTSSQVAIDGGFPASTLSGSSRRITWQSTWAAGVATASAIAEVVLTNEASLTNVAGTAANTVARALLSPVVNKAAGDTLVVSWAHDLLGA